MLAGISALPGMPDNARNNDPSGTPSADPLPVGGTSDSTEQATINEVLSMLANERRRHLLSFLTDRSGETVPVDVLADAVMEPERPAPGPLSHRRRVQIDLHHVHLPKLADAGVIEHDPVESTVKYVGPDELAGLLDATAAFDGGD